MKITFPDPPLVQEVRITHIRKWWQLWKPKTWVELVEQEFYVIYDFEGQSFIEGFRELLKTYEDEESE